MENKLKIYPIPSISDIIIETDTHPIEKIQIYNQTGTIAYSIDNLNTLKTSIDISNFENGIYNCKIISGENTIVKKIVKF